MTVPFDELDQIRRKLGKIGQGFMNDNRFEGRGSGGGPTRWAFGWNAFALHQKDRLVVFAAQHRVVAFEEHDVSSIGAKPREYKINITILETTLQKHKTRTGKVYFT